MNGRGWQGVEIEITSDAGKVTVTFIDGHRHPVSFEMSPEAALRLGTRIVRGAANASLIWSPEELAERHKLADCECPTPENCSVLGCGRL